MCANCVSTGAIAAGATATGIRAYVAAWAPTWLTPRRKTVMTRVLMAGFVIGAGVLGPSVG